MPSIDNGLNESEALCVIDRVGELRIPVTLIHGATDNVIQPAQSGKLFERLQEAGVTSELSITPMLSHSDTQFGIWTTIRHAPALIRAFGAFIGRTRAG